jgi:hypothetical protein
MPGWFRQRAAGGAEARRRGDGGRMGPAVSTKSQPAPPLPTTIQPPILLAGWNREAIRSSCGQREGAQSVTRSAEPRRPCPGGRSKGGVLPPVFDWPSVSHRACLATFFSASSNGYFSKASQPARQRRLWQAFHVAEQGHGVIPAVGIPDGCPALGPTAMKVVPIRQELPRPV